MFREVERAVEREEIKLRNLRRSDPDQVSLFSDDDLADFAQGVKGVGCAKYKALAEQRIVEFLQERPRSYFKAVALHAVSEVPIRMTDAKDIANDMRRRAVLSFDLEPGMRKPQEHTVLTLANNRA